MSNKLMIIAYNDEGKCCVSNYCDGEIEVYHTMIPIEQGEKFCNVAEPLFTDVEMKGLHKHELTLKELDDVISWLKGLKESKR